MAGRFLFVRAPRAASWRPRPRIASMLTRQHIPYLLICRSASVAPASNLHSRTVGLEMGHTWPPFTRPLTLKDRPREDPSYVGPPPGSPTRYAYTQARALRGVGGRPKRRHPCDVEPGASLNLYKIAHSESTVDKWNNRAFRLSGDRSHYRSRTCRTNTTFNKEFRTSSCPLYSI